MSAKTGRRKNRKAGKGKVRRLVDDRVNSVEQLLEKTHRVVACDQGRRESDARVKKCAKPSDSLVIMGRSLPAPRNVLLINAAK